MCDFGLHDVKSRAARVGDKLTTRQFPSGTRGFCALEDATVAVCLLPGTELSFAEEVRRVRSWPWTKTFTDHKTAIFRQINQDNPATHHDALEFPDGQIVLLTLLETGSARHRSAVTGGGCWCYGHARSRLRLTAIGREQSASTPPTKAVLFSFGKPPAARYRIERAVIPIKGPIALRSPLQRDSINTPVQRGPLEQRRACAHACCTCE